MLPAIARLLPDTWSVSIEASGNQIDGDLLLRGPRDQRLRYALQWKRSAQSISTVMAVLRDQARTVDGPVVYFSDYLGKSLRTALEAEGFSYADATGWVRLSSEDPLVLLTGQGATKAPSLDQSTETTRLNGSAAGRIVRTLCERDLPIGVRELAAAAGISPGSVSKLLPTLVREGIIDRDPRGSVTVVRRRDLISRWAQDYSFSKTNRQVAYYLAPRGLDRLLDRIAETQISATLTGSAAARQMLAPGTTSVVPLKLLALYSRAPESLARELGLVSTERANANVMIAVPQDDAVLDSPRAPVALVLADLLTLPGRGNAEPEQLMDALAPRDPAWSQQ